LHIPACHVPIKDLDRSRGRFARSKRWGVEAIVTLKAATSIQPLARPALCPNQLLHRPQHGLPHTLAGRRSPIGRTEMASETYDRNSVRRRLF
jgi:hypothetical protein